MPKEIDIMKIPKPLRKETFRFVKIPQGKKGPFEKKWQSENNYSWNSTEIQKHLSSGGNYGVVCGYGDLTVIDADTKEVAESVVKNLPETLVVRTGGGGLHYYFQCRGLDKPLRLGREEAGDMGDVQWKGKQVVGPKCIHPSGNRYRIIKNRNIAIITADELKSALSAFIQGKQKKRQSTENPPTQTGEFSENHSAVYDVSAKDVVIREGGNTNPSRRWPSPFHGSSTGMNTSFSREGLIHCWRHSVAMNGLQALAVLSGYATCGEVGTPHRGGSGVLDDGAIFHAWKYAKEEGYIPADDPIPVRAMNYIAEEHGVCNPNKYEYLPKWAYNRVLDIVEEKY